MNGCLYRNFYDQNQKFYILWHDIERKRETQKDKKKENQNEKKKKSRPREWLLKYITCERFIKHFDYLWPGTGG